MPKFSDPADRPDAIREEILDALLHADRSHHDELGRTGLEGAVEEPSSHSSPREQAAAPIDLHNIDE